MKHSTGMSRRGFLVGAGAAAWTAGAAAMPVEQRHAASGAAADTVYTFFTPAQARFIEAAVARLIPTDEIGPGAMEAGVPSYLDKQLGGAWGAGERLYRSGPWQAGVPTQGYQLPFTPAELFRNALRAIDADLQRSHNTSFDRLSGEQQDAYLTQLQNGEVNLDTVPSKVFFESLWEMTLEGYFSDPVYGGNRDMKAWAMIGFPGAYAEYYDLVDLHGLEFHRAPMSLAQNGAGQVHLEPDIKAESGKATTAEGH